MKKSIIYSFIARGGAKKNEQGVILVEYTEDSGNFQILCASIYQEQQKNKLNERQIFQVNDQYQLFYHNDNNFCCACLCEVGFSTEAAFSFLNVIRTEFLKETEIERITGMQFSFNERLARFLNNKMKEFENKPIDALDRKLDHINVVLKENINKLLKRSEDIEVLVKKSQNIQHQTLDIKGMSNEYQERQKAKQCQKYAFMGAVGSIATLAIIFLI